MEDGKVMIKSEYKAFSFKGSGKEFFRIWIVNIALTILTLGIYSAWAKVRTNRYFYANTYLNGSNFEYNAEPKRILIGRVIVVGFYALFMLFAQYLAMLKVSIAIATVALLAMPWLIRQAVSFKLRNTSYRNVPFRYEGSTLSFYKFFIINILIFIAIGATLYLQIPIVFIILSFLFSGFVYIGFKKLIIDNSYYGNGKFYFEGEVKKVYSMYFKIGGYLSLITLILSIIFALFAFIFSIVYDLSEFKNINFPPQLLPIISMIFVSFVYIFIIFLQKGLSDGFHLNFVRSNTKLDNAPLKGDVSPLNMAWISVSNILAVLLSLGLLYPWAKVRYTRYKLENTYFKCDDYDKFESQGYERGSTLGEETMDFFDIDIGL
jgi:uncharacterized membrane protein YjgN (DUF898 family)